ncbi:hypothetical protein KSD_64920 [Ktedonobacter sp. SOSP1-85]|nr:hypothetical protein [Ktedonobacter sp. SOSP1-85]GHO78721.1 hypothetical protein KSD_64920 [Ktedonobacter sp. SOSP1-85]
MQPMKNFSINRRRFIKNSALTLGTVAGASALLEACNANASSGGGVASPP